MTAAERTALVDQYRAGLEAALRLLDRLSGVANRQHDIAAARDYRAFGPQADEREELMHSLVAVETHLKSIRAALAAERVDIRTIPAFADVARLQSEAAARITAILTVDQASLKSLAGVELARRAALASLERGNSTLAAYRKVLEAPRTNAALVNRHG